MDSLSNLAISDIKVSPGTTSGDSVIATKRGFFVAKIEFAADTQPDLTKLKFAMKSFTVGTVDRLKYINVERLGAFKSVQGGTPPKYIQTGYCVIKVDEGIGYGISFDKALEFELNISVDDGATWSTATCAVDVVDNSGVDVTNCQPEMVGGSTALDFNPIGETGQPTNANKPVLIQVKALTSASAPSPKTYVNISIEKNAITGILTDKKVRFFVQKSDGTPGDELLFEQRNDRIRTSVPTDIVGIAIIACYPTTNITNDNIFSFRLSVIMPNSTEVRSEEDAVFMTGLNFKPLENIIEIEGQDGNNVYYDDKKTSLHVLIPSYQDATSTDKIFVINKGYNAADNTTLVCATKEVYDGSLFYGYLTEVSYLNVVPNSWNEMRYISRQKDNVYISDPNLWRFISPSVIDIDPPKVIPTEPVPELIFTSEDGKIVHHIGVQYDYSLNSSCINYGGKLELTVNFDPTHVQEKDAITVSYGIKAFKEGTGKRELNYAKATLTEPSTGAWQITAADITAKSKKIEIPQKTFIGFDGDEHGNNGTMWLMANIAVSCHSEVLWMEIDSVGPGE